MAVLLSTVEYRRVQYIIVRIINQNTCENCYYTFEKVREIENHIEYSRGKSGCHHIFVNPELRLKPCLVVTQQNHCTPYHVW